MNFSKWGFPYQDNLLMAFIGGSQLYGTAIEGSDEDWLGVFVPSPDKLLGLNSYDHFVLEANEAKQVPDTTLHSLKKFANLAASGNPTVLGFLFANPQFSTTAWEYITKNRDLFLSRAIAKAYHGFADQQWQRLNGLRGQKNVNRASLHEQFGYDTKYAMHVLRLYWECAELMRDSKLTFPRPEAETLRAVREGKFSLEEFNAMAQDAKTDAQEAEQGCKLPASVNRDKIGGFIAQMHLDIWDGHY